MKIRTGFVSNSSSSSFIIGIVNASKDGRNDIGKEFWLKDADYNSWRGCYIWGWPESRILVRPKDDGKFILEIESFMGNTVSCEAVEGDRILYLDGTGPDSDEYFSIYNDNDEWIDIDYDRLDFDDFEDKDKELYCFIYNLGGHVDFGAGRNG